MLAVPQVCSAEPAIPSSALSPPGALPGWSGRGLTAPSRPQAMSYATVAGLPPVYGLYNAFVGLLPYPVGCRLSLAPPLPSLSHRSPPAGHSAAPRRPLALNNCPPPPPQPEVHGALTERPLLLLQIFGTSPALISGPTAVMSILVGSVVPATIHGKSCGITPPPLDHRCAETGELDGTLTQRTLGTLSSGVSVHPCLSNGIPEGHSEAGESRPGHFDGDHRQSTAGGLLISSLTAARRLRRHLPRTHRALPCPCNDRRHPAGAYTCLLLPLPAPGMIRNPRPTGLPQPVDLAQLADG